jgi:hypothetical protein
MSKPDYKKNSSFFVETMLRMTKRCADRDNTVMLAMRHENFAEYVDEHKQFFVLAFSDFDNFLVAVIRNYVMAQLSCITHDKENEKVHELRDLFNAIIVENLESYKEIIKLMSPSTLNELEYVHESALSIV